MATSLLLCLCLGVLAMVHAGDPTVSFDWKVTYGQITPLGVTQQGILINGEFPGPVINVTTNNNIVVNVHNQLDEPFLLTWNGIQHRKNSWVDGTPGTMCPIQPGTNYTYQFQVKDQIGSFYYFPTLALHRASGGFGGLQIHSRPLIPIPFPTPTGEFNVLMGDWFNIGHKALKNLLDNGRSLSVPDGILINGKSGKVGGKNEPMFTFKTGETYRFRVCNIGMKTSLNFRIQGHDMKLVEIEGSHTMQNMYKSLDLHVGQCMSVLVDADQKPMDYYLVASSRFIKIPLVSVALIRYAHGQGAASPALPSPPSEDESGIAWSINQFRTFRWNLTASAARPNPQGTYHYGKIKITRTFKLMNSEAHVNGKLRFAVNGVSHVNTLTPLKLAEYFGLQKKVFSYNVMTDAPKDEKDTKVVLAQNVVNATYRAFIEIVFENKEKTIQTWQLDGYSFFAVAIETGMWTPSKRGNYNMLDAVSRQTIQVYPGSWAAVLTALDNVGMWNLRSQMWARVYLGQQFYLSVQSPVHSTTDEYHISNNTMLCGMVKGLPTPAHNSV